MQSLLARMAQFARKRRRLAIRLAGAAAIALALLFALSALSPLERLNVLVFDSYQKLKPRPPAESAVVVVDIDDESIRRLGQWPWPRTVLARVIDRLTAEGAAAIGLDIILSEPDRTSPALAVAQLQEQGFTVTAPGPLDELDHDRVLAASFARAPVVAGLVLAPGLADPPPAPKAGVAFAGDDPAAYLPAYPGSVRNLEILDAAATGIGVFSFPPVLDGVVRLIPLFSRHGTALYPALSIETLRVAQGAAGFLVRSTGAAGEPATGNPGMTMLKVGEFEVPTDPDGTIWVYYAASPQAPVIPVHRLLGTDADPAVSAAVAGRIALIGTSAIGLRDIVSTSQAAGVPGVFVHAEIIDQIVARTFVSRPDWAPGLELVAAVVLGALMLAALPWFSTLGNAVLMALAAASAIGAGWYGFERGALLLSPILPVLGALAAYGAGSAARLLVSESEGRYIRGAFTHYLSPAMVERLVENPQSLVLGGENRELTLLFCDIRGFTGISESMEPTELTDFLNGFLTPMTGVLMQSGATIDKYMGDAIMAFWNAPLDIPAHRQRAAQAVLEMLLALEALNARLERPIRIGVGLNTGVCCVGNLGSRQRFDYSAIGDAVNVASRIEGLTKQYGLSNLMADATASEVEGLAMLEVDQVAVVGRDEAMAVFTLVGGPDIAGSAAFAALSDLHRRFLDRYRACDFAAAGENLAALAALPWPQLSGIYAAYAKRLEAFALAPPPPGWDGIWRAEHK